MLDSTSYSHGSAHVVGGDGRVLESNANDAVRIVDFSCSPLSAAHRSRRLDISDKRNPVGAFNERADTFGVGSPAQLHVFPCRRDVVSGTPQCQRW